MKLKTLYQETIKKGIDVDIRGKDDIALFLRKQKQTFQKCEEKEKEFFDTETLSNPFADTRILFGDPETNIRSILVGIDVEGEELLLADRLREKGQRIDLALAHHPEGRAYAHFYGVMDVQIDIFRQTGIPVSISQNLVGERKEEVRRRVHAANHERSVDIARLLNINLLCIHTPADNCAYQYVSELVVKEKPKTMGDILEMLYQIPEYHAAAKNNTPPLIAVGDRNARTEKIHVEFTGGTEGPQNIYEKLSQAGVDTIIAMHQSEEHVKKCREEHINVIFAPHIASDALGMNLILDHLEQREKFKIYECSGFRRYKH